MPRKPTGRPPGRPRGSGQLADARRITVWLTGEVYDKLNTYADGRHYHRGDPELAACVRELLAHALACPYKNQTENIPPLPRDSNRQIETVPLAPENSSEQIETITASPENNYYEQTQTVPLVTETSYGQIETVPTPAENSSRQTAIVPDQRDTVPDYDSSKFYLGKLCPRGHDYHGTGQSLLRKHNQHCRECENESRREGRARKKAAREAATV
jgi:hypothetical protein